MRCPLSANRWRHRAWRAPIDINHTPLRWELSDTRRSQLWGLPALARWFYEASAFAEKTVHKPVLKADPVTLESFLAKQF